MKTRAALTLCIAGAALLALPASYGGCQPDPCPDLNVACPELECSDGFVVDKDGCAICECVGEPLPTECLSDEDCAEGFYCDFSAIALENGEVNCLGGDEEMNCILPEEGECRPVEEPEACAALEEWACIERVDCEPLYETLPCYFYCDAEDPDCICDEVSFIGCREAEGPEECFGAWIDQDGFCRAPNDGVYPAHCCGLTECWGDYDCAWGEFCDYPWDTAERPAGDGDQADPALVAEPGICRPIEPECWSDLDCPEGFYCDFSTWADGARPADGDDGGAAPDVMYGGFCQPMVSDCADLDEQTCLSAPACAPVYEEFCYPCDCADGTDCECWSEDLCERIFIGCEPVAAPECRSDADCPNGYCEVYDTCAGLDCPPPPPAQCVYPNCDDNSTSVCEIVPPTCAPGEVLAVRDSCWACVDARTCQPFTVCIDDEECPEGFYCELGYYGGEPIDCGGDPTMDCLVVGQCMPLQLDCSVHIEAEACASAGCAWTECPPNAMCDVPGWCEVEAVDPIGCGADADCVAGEYCDAGICLPL